MEIAGKKVLVFGSGISGIGAAGILEGRGAQVTLYDANEKLQEKELREKMRGGENTRIVLGKFPETLLGELDLVVISPGVPTDLPVVKLMRQKNGDLSRIMPGWMSFTGTEGSIWIQMWR